MAGTGIDAVKKQKNSEYAKRYRLKSTAAMHIIFSRIGCSLLTCDMYMCRLRHIHDPVLITTKDGRYTFLCMFISILYMFRPVTWPSSGELIVSIRHLVYVTLYRWLFGVQVWMRQQSSLIKTCTPNGRLDHDQQHCYHHAPKVKPEAAIAVVELLMMGVRTPETCWAVNKH
jgi:hypothetical protein